MLRKAARLVLREIEEALPAALFFLLLFHMVALTRAVSLGDYTLAAIRATAATVGALIVAKAILVVEALPIARLFPGRGLVQILWKTALYGLVALLFRLIEELVPLAYKYGSLPAAAKSMYVEVSWPLFVVLTLWITGGLVFYCLASKIIRAVGAKRAREILVGSRIGDGASRPDKEP